MGLAGTEIKGRRKLGLKERTKKGREKKEKIRNTPRARNQAKVPDKQT